LGGIDIKETVLKRYGLEKEKIINISDLFDELCPFYMSIGMSYDEYWHGDNYAYKYYLKAYELKKKREMDLLDYKCWLTGLYTYEAICDCSPILHDFVKKGTKPLRYPDKPIFMGYDSQKQKHSKKEIENGRLAFRVQMDTWMRANQKRFANEKKGGSE
jgi:hypothetical protein